MPERMASASAASLSPWRSPPRCPVPDDAGPALLHPASSAAAAAQPNTTTHRHGARRRCGAARNRFGASRWLPGSRLMSDPP